MCGRLTLTRDEPTPDRLLARHAFAKGITGRPSPMQPIPLVTGPDSCVIARWGWPSARGSILTHARSETASTLPASRDAWRLRRGVVPVEGWEEGSWIIAAPGAHLAVLWTAEGNDVRLAVLTQPSPTAHQHIDRFPVPLTLAGGLLPRTCHGIMHHLPLVDMWTQNQMRIGCSRLCTGTTAHICHTFTGLISLTCVMYEHEGRTQSSCRLIKQVIERTGIAVAVLVGAF